MKLPEMKYILSEKKNSLDRIKNRLGSAEERTSEFEESNRNYIMKHRKSKKSQTKNPLDLVTCLTRSSCLTYMYLSPRMRGEENRKNKQKNPQRNNGHKKSPSLMKTINEKIWENLKPQAGQSIEQIDTWGTP